MRFFLISTILCLSIFQKLSAQVSDLVANEGFTSDFHKNNVGKIFFCTNDIPLTQLKASDLLSTYKLTNKSDLYFVAYLNNSVSNYLHKIKPNLSADSLLKVGNYQFTLLIDDKIAYQSNLLPGAPRAEVQNRATTINKPLINNTNGNGLWSESFWNRFMKQRGDSVLTEGSHVMKMEIRTYLKTDKISVGELIASGSLNLIVERKPIIDLNKIKLNPLVAYNGFKVSKEKFDVNKIKELKGNIDEGVFKKIKSVVLIKNGKILIEEYFNGADRNTLHNPRSVGKSFASTMTGIAIADNYLNSENQTLKEFYDLKNFANPSSKKEAITIKDIMTMSSAFEGNDDDYNSIGNEENMYPTDNWVKFTLDLPTKADSEPKKWQYFTAGAMLLGDIIHQNVPGGLEAYAQKKLFGPLGISKYEWQYTPQKVANTAGGIQMNAMDFAKYGQLYKNKGKWNGKQIVPKAWVEKTFIKHIQIAGRQNEYYGYLFWNKTFTVNNKDYEAFYCAGNGGNHIVILKDLPIVIVITGTAYGQYYAHSQVAKIISEYLLPAVVN